MAEKEPYGDGLESVARSASPDDIADAKLLDVDAMKLAGVLLLLSQEEANRS
jgi:hypothetical protein